MKESIENEYDVSYEDSIDVNKSRKVCSFIPSVTQIINALGLQECLVGVTFECPSDKPAVIHSSLEGLDLSVAQINEKIQWHQSNKIPVNTIDKALLEKLQPDIIFTQELCNVCQIGEDDVCSVLEDLGMEVALYSLNPKSFGDVEDTIKLVAEVLGEAERGEALLTKLKTEIKPITNQLLKGKAVLKEVLFLEWMNPMFSAGHWIPDQIMMAGAVDRLSNPHGKSVVITEEQLAEYQPEVIIISPCGMTFEEAESQMAQIDLATTLGKTQAWKNKQVFLADGSLFTQPAIGLYDGVALLAGLFYPDEFSIPPHVKASVKVLA